MKVNGDSFFTIGNHHVVEGIPCQDYALTCERPGGGYLAVVSDGCSASPDTDIGSRVMCHTLRQKFRQYESVKTLANSMRETCETMVQTFGLPREFMDATLCYAIYKPRPNNLSDIEVTIIGDGSFYVTNRDGSTEFYTIDWALNMPPYLSYNFDEMRKYSLIATGQTGTLVKVFDTGFATIEGGPVSMHHSLNEELIYTFSSEHVLSVSLMSDGVGQITGEFPSDVADDLNSFKNYEGIFVKRRALRMLGEYAKFGHIPMDDLSIATLHFDRD